MHRLRRATRAYYTGISNRELAPGGWTHPWGPEKGVVSPSPASCAPSDGRRREPRSPSFPEPVLEYWPNRLDVVARPAVGRRSLKYSYSSSGLRRAGPLVFFIKRPSWHSVGVNA